MHMLTIALGLCCLAVAQSSYHSGHDIQLNAVPDISSYGKLNYPHLDIQDLGEYSLGEHHPEVIQIEKTVEVKVPQPFPVQVPHKVPYPVPYKVPQIIKVPQVVQVSHPVPVEVIKPVPVSKAHEGSFGIENEGAGNAHGVGVSAGEDYGGATLDSAAIGSYNGDHQTDWQGVSTQAYASPQAFGGSAEAFGAGQGLAGFPANQHADYSGVQQGGYAHIGQLGHVGDYSADASSTSVVQDVKPVVEPTQQGLH